MAQALAVSDPSWPQIVWLYGLAAIFVFVNSNRLALGIGLVIVVTALVAIKVMRGLPRTPMSPQDSKARPRLPHATSKSACLFLKADHGNRQH